MYKIYRITKEGIEEVAVSTTGTEPQLRKSLLQRFRDKSDECLIGFMGNGDAFHVYEKGTMKYE